MAVEMVHLPPPKFFSREKDCWRVMNEIASYGPNEAIQNSKSNTCLLIKPKFYITVKMTPRTTCKPSSRQKYSLLTALTITTILYSLQSSQSTYANPAIFLRAASGIVLLSAINYWLNVPFTRLILRGGINLACSNVCRCYLACLISWRI